MARGDRVAPGERVVRYVKPAQFEDETVFSSAFDLRPATNTRPVETGLSVHRREFFDADLERDLAALRIVIVGQGFEMKPRGGLAEIAVADVDAVSDMLGLGLAVIEEPLNAEEAKPANPAHAEIYGLPLPGVEPTDVRAQRVGNELARRCRPIYPTR